MSASRPVYSTDEGRLCSKCGWPIDECCCSRRGDEPVPARPSCVLRLEKKGRGGKSVTVVAGLPRNQPFLATLAATLKRVCGTGGTATDDAVELQGDHREKLRSLLLARGWVVKG